MKYWKKDHREEDAIYYLSRSTRNWALVVGLEPDTYYWVKVMAYNAAGEGPESERFLERTYRKAPQKPPSSVHIYGINPSTIKVVWRYVSPSQEEEPVEGYKIRIWEADQDMATANDTLVSLGRKLEYIVDTLTPGTKQILVIMCIYKTTSVSQAKRINFEFWLTVMAVMVACLHQHILSKWVRLVKTTEFISSSLLIFSLLLSKFIISCQNFFLLLALL